MGFGSGQANPILIPRPVCPPHAPFHLHPTLPFHVLWVRVGASIWHAMSGTGRSWANHGMQKHVEEHSTAVGQSTKIRQSQITSSSSRPVVFNLFHLNGKALKWLRQNTSFLIMGKHTALPVGGLHPPVALLLDDFQIPARHLGIICSTPAALD